MEEFARKFSPLALAHTGVVHRAVSARRWYKVGTVIAVTSKPTPLYLAVEQRREDLGLTLKELADRAGISIQTIITIRDRTTPPSTRQAKAERKLEEALGWTVGSIQRIRDGGEPTLLAHGDIEAQVLADPTFTDAEKRRIIEGIREVIASRTQS